jgi:SPP1 family holin
MKKLKDILGHITEVPAGTWIRLALMLMSFVNRILLTAGVNLLPFTEDEVSAIIADGFIVLTCLYGFWKNESFTGAALEADKYLKDLREKEGKQ